MLDDTFLRRLLVGEVSREHPQSASDGQGGQQVAEREQGLSHKRALLPCGVRRHDADDAFEDILIGSAGNHRT
jgi:hypothetical protein